MSPTGGYCHTNPALLQITALPAGVGFNHINSLAPSVTRKNCLCSLNLTMTSNDHRARRLVSEFIGTSGLTFVLSGGAAILAGYGGASLAPYQYAFILSAASALWWPFDFRAIRRPAAGFSDRMDRAGGICLECPDLSRYGA
jgi:hypothetical protein